MFHSTACFLLSSYLTMKVPGNLKVKNLLNKIKDFPLISPSDVHGKLCVQSSILNPTEMFELPVFMSSKVW